MAAVFTNFAREQIFSGGINFTLPIKIVMFRYAPSLESTDNTETYAQARTVTELTANVGWEEVAGIGGYPFTNTIGLGLHPQGSSLYTMFTEYVFSQLTEPVEVMAFGVVMVGTVAGVTNPLLFVTDTLGASVTVRPGDAFSARLDPDVPSGNQRWMFAWQPPAATPPAGQTMVTMVEGPLAISAATPAYDVSNTQHVWLYPQRANMIANPSFERDTAYWACNGAISRVAGAAPDDPPYSSTMDDNFMRPPITREPRAPRASSSSRAYAGHFTGGAPIVVESNIFPLKVGDMPSEAWTVQLMAKGDGLLKVGLVYWDPDVRYTAVDWGLINDETDTESWQLSPDGWTHVAVHRTAFEGRTAMVRLETDGTFLTLDNVLAERLYLRDWPYFDGDSTFGARDDFSWYGAAVDPGRRGASYSLWYNNRRAVVGRLFARLVDVNDPANDITDDQIEEMGLVYRWVPAGTTVIPHMDVFFPGDSQAPPHPKVPTDVLPYAPPDDDAPTGVINPW